MFSFLAAFIIQTVIADALFPAAGSQPICDDACMTYYTASSSKIIRQSCGHQRCSLA